MDCAPAADGWRFRVSDKVSTCSMLQIADFLPTEDQPISPSRVLLLFVDKLILESFGDYAQSHRAQLIWALHQILAILRDRLLPVSNMLTQLRDGFASRVFLNASESSNIGNGTSADKLEMYLSPSFKSIAILKVRELASPLIDALIHEVENKTIEFLSNFPSIHAIDCTIEKVDFEDLGLGFFNVDKK